MRTGPARAASSSRANDHSAQSRSFVTRSSSTFVSTKTKSTLPARQGHDLVSAQALAGVAAQAREPARSSLLPDLHKDDAAIPGSFEIDNATGSDPHQVANLLGDCDL